MNDVKPRLTPREQQVLALVELGSKAEETARLFRIKTGTVDKHRYNARRKVDARTLSQWSVSGSNR